GGGVPGSLAPRSTTRQASGTQLLRASKPVGKPLRHLDRRPPKGVNLVPAAPGTGYRKQPQLSPTGPAAVPEEIQHRVRLATIPPFVFGHGAIPKAPSPAVNALVHRSPLML